MRGISIFQKPHYREFRTMRGLPVLILTEVLDNFHSPAMVMSQCLDNFHSTPILLPPWVDYGNYHMLGDLAILILLTYKKNLHFFLAEVGLELGSPDPELSALPLS